MKPIEELQLQRLVDGELSPLQVQQMLTDAKVSPNQWQEIAVGFVENQIWNRAFENDVHTMNSNASEPNSTVGSLLKKGSVASEAKRVAPIQSGTRESKLESNRATGFSWLVMAASLIVAATIGYMLNQIQSRSLPGSSIADTHSIESNPLLAANSEPRESDPGLSNVDPIDHSQITQADYHLEVPQEKIGELDVAGPVAQVPLISVRNARDLRNLNLLNERQSSPAISQEVLDRLAGFGYRLQQDVEFMSGRLNDGRSFVVPVRTMRFVSGQ